MMRTKIVYEDKYLLVVHKPAGLATQTAKVGQQDVVSELKNYFATQNTKQNTTAPYVGVIHRLDQPVEGLLVFAKDTQTAAALTKQLGSGTLNKQYYAAICGKPCQDTGELVDYLYKDSQGKAQVVTEQFALNQQSKYPDAKKAVLQYRILKALSSEDAVYMADIHIDTGRFHQIRAQMAHAGMPLLGDSKYGSEASAELSRLRGIRNVALCAYSLEFVHPLTKENLRFQVEPENKAF